MTAADRATVAVTLMIVGAGVWIFVAGPTEVMPYHYGFDGQADAWAGREAIGPGIAGLGLLTGVLAGGMGLAAGRADTPARARALRSAQLLVLLTLLTLTLFAGVAAVTGLTEMGRAGPMAGLSLLFLIVGAFAGRVGPNPFFGVRTPWSLKSRLAWDRSNRLAGRLFFITGLLGLVAAPVAPQPLGYQGLIIAVVVAAFLAVVESWRVWRTDPDRQPF
ncbi:MAG: SdpI family protein [Alphaproteobacteria bacterium]|nr:SdpI family protein [Alphaproteobacteria bacterium]MBU2309094.1 SdpI family protein [Alphaproteobacteria bacterium]MBU2417477.1 SdpI family protein [Alphaproteobacteria bacterium]